MVEVLVLPGIHQEVPSARQIRWKPPLGVALQMAETWLAVSLGSVRVVLFCSVTF